MVRNCAGLVLILWLALVPGPAKAFGVADVKSRGETIRLVVQGPSDSKAVVVLFAGGHGVLKIDENGYIRKLGGNFLIRSSYFFRGKGMVTVVIDAPSDRTSNMFRFRSTKDHARDVAAVIAYLRLEFGLPVWLVGTSRGTESVANAATRLKGPDGPDGIVLTASMLTNNRNGVNLLSMDLADITLPVIIAHHKRDRCDMTPPHRVAALVEKFESAKVIDVLWYDGGSPRGKVCQARHYHGFIDQEKRVIEDIADAIMKTLPGGG